MKTNLINGNLNDSLLNWHQFCWILSRLKHFSSLIHDFDVFHVECFIRNTQLIGSFWSLNQILRFYVNCGLSFQTVFIYLISHSFWFDVQNKWVILFAMEIMCSCFHVKKITLLHIFHMNINTKKYDSHLICSHWIEWNLKLYGRKKKIRFQIVFSPILENYFKEESQ